MPTRLIHEEILESPSLLRCSPRAQDAFPRIIVIADSFGCFIADPDKVKAQAWRVRPDITARDVAGFFVEWSRAAMLFLWEQEERVFGYLTGWFGRKGQRWWPEYRGKKQGGKGRDLKGSGRRTPRPPGWLGVRETPWQPPSDWVPGEVWRGSAFLPAQIVDVGETLDLPLPAREAENTVIPLPASPYASSSASSSSSPTPERAAARAGEGGSDQQVAEPCGAGSPAGVQPAAPAAPLQPAAAATGTATRPAGSPVGAQTPAAPAGPGVQWPYPTGLPAEPTIRRLAVAVAQDLSIIGPGGVGIEVGQSRHLGEIIRHANQAVEQVGFDVVRQALVARGREMMARQDPPQTMAAFARTLRVLAEEPVAARNGNVAIRPRRCTAPAEKFTMTRKRDLSEL